MPPMRMIPPLACCSILLAISACVPKQIDVYRPAPIDAGLLAPIPAPALRGETTGDVARLIVDQAEALDRCNGQLLAIGKTVAGQGARE